MSELEKEFDKQVFEKAQFLLERVKALETERDALKLKLESLGNSHGFALATNIELGKQIKVWRSLAEGLAEAFKKISTMPGHKPYDWIEEVANAALASYAAAKRGTK